MDEIDALVNELPDEVVEYISELQDNVTQLTKRLEDAEEIAKSEAAAEEEVDERSTLEKALDGIEDEDARDFIIEKLNTLAEREAQDELDVIEKRDSEFIAKARAFDGLGNPDDIGPALRRLADQSPEDADLIEKALTAAAAQVEESTTIYDEIGHAVSKSADSDTVGKIEAIAKSYQEADPALDDEAAKAMAWENNAELYDEYVLEQRQNQRL